VEEESSSSAFACDPACLEHGECLEDGSCRCHEGWNGPLRCSIEGCPHNCRAEEKRGSCIQVKSVINQSMITPSSIFFKEGEEWKCSCEHGFSGEGCEMSIETECGDKEDNDGGDFTLT